MEILSWLELLKTLATSKIGEVTLETATKGSWLQKLWKSMQKEQEQQEIIVLGYSGVGKTQFLHSLQEEKQYIVPPRTSIAEEHPIKLEKMPLTLVDTSGQESFPEQRRGVFQEKITDKKLVGIINVVSYGYQESKNILPTIALDSNKDSDTTKKSSLELNREAEMEYLAEWLPFLEMSKVQWVITLVNKMDIWRQEADKVQDHYENPQGDYQKAFDATFKHFKIHHQVLPYSSLLSMFMGKLPIYLGETEKDLLQKHFKQTLLDVMTKIKRNV